MAFIKRIALFGLINVLIVASLTIVLRVLGVGYYYTPYGMDYKNLLGFCLVWGMGSALISLALSRILAKHMMGVAIVDSHSRDGQERLLVDTVMRLARAARLPAMPQVGIYPSPEVNAFATGPTKSRALVAVSSGLLHRLSQAEIEGVLGHEITHIANGDMVTMTLLQGVVNAFSMFASRAIAFILTQTSRDENNSRKTGPTFSTYILQFVLEIIFTLLGSMLVAWFSRRREFRADAGSVRLAGRAPMTQALQALQRSMPAMRLEASSAIQSLQISGPAGRFLGLFATHPSLEERLHRLAG